MVTLYNPEAVVGTGDQQNSDIEWIDFDAVLSVTHEGRNTVTRYPVEAGASPADHSRPEPRGITLGEAIVTNYPAKLPGLEALAGVAAAGLSLDSIASAAQPSGFESLGIEALTVDPRAEQAWEQLDRWRELGTPLVLVDQLKEYESVVIESITTPRDAQRSSAIHPSIRLVELQTATTGVVEAPIPQSTRTSPQKGKGNKGTDVATEAEKGNGSALFNLAGEGTSNLLGLGF